MNEYTTPIQPVIEDLSSLVTELEKKKKIPKAATVDRIEASDIEHISTKLASNFGTSKYTHINRFSETKNEFSYSTKHSTVLTVNTTAVGFIVAVEPKADNAFLYAVYIEKKYRCSWATPYLKYRSLIHLAKLGIHSINFQAYNNNADTIKHAHRVSAIKCDD